MKALFKKIIVSTACVFLCGGLSSLAVDIPKTVRVGLYYGENALSAPQLQNAEGSGYAIGFYDDEMQFHTLYSLSDTKIAILKDENYQKNGNQFVPSAGSSALVGAYQVQLSGSYPNQAEASAIAQKENGYVAFSHGTYVVRKGNYSSLVSAQAAAAPLGGTAVGGNPLCTTIVQSENGTILLEYENNKPLGILPQGSPALTWFKGYKYFGGFSYPRAKNGNFAVLNFVDTEQYIKGVIPYEMNPNWNMEALKAQAICARSYAVCERKHKADGFDLCATTHCQVYHGQNLSTPNSNKAVEETTGIVALSNGKPAQLFYFSSDGGATEDAKNVWGGEYPYLVGKTDPYELSAKPEKAAVWSKTLTNTQIEQKLRTIDASFGALAQIAVAERTPVGNVLTVQAKDTAGKIVTLSKATCRSLFSLNSQRYTITPLQAEGIVSVAPPTIGAGILQGFLSAMQGHALPRTSQNSATPTSYRFDGTGWGHHVGMSQYGAKAMADQGKTYADILHFYFTNITLTNENR